MQSFKDFLAERILSIGLNPEHEPLREKHRQAIHDILHKSYADIGGYGKNPSGSKEESDAIHHDISHSMIKAVKRGDSISAAVLYKDQHGRKSIAGGTDKSRQGSKDFNMIRKEDKSQERSWGEASGKVEAGARKIEMPVIHPSKVGKLIGKDVKPIDDESYEREIGGIMTKKTAFGYPKEKA